MTRKEKIIFFGLIILIISLFIGTFYKNKKNIERREDIIEENNNKIKKEIEDQEKLDREIKQREEKEEKIKEKERKSFKRILVNKDNPLPKNYKIELKNIDKDHKIDKRAYKDLKAMLDDAKKENLKLIICSSYRKPEKQEKLFKDKYNKCLKLGMDKKEAYNETKKWIALPGTSEHELGLALDIVSEDYQKLDKKQENTREQKWLMENSYKYGFILRYPTDKSHITGIGYEPWHYRYVGKKIAKEIYELNISFEEYLEKY